MTYILPSARPIPLGTRTSQKRGGDVTHRDMGRVRPLLALAAKKARGRSALRGQESDVTTDDLIRLYEAQNGRCALTGLTFSTVRHLGAYRNPYYPSVDRIDPSLGYVEGNYRLVVLIANVARGEYGDEVFYALCEAAVRYRGGLPKRGRGAPKKSPYLP